MNDTLCPYCSSTQQNQIAHWNYCYNHKPVEVLWTYDNRILIYVHHNDGVPYGMYWHDEKTLDLWQAIEPAKIILQRANIERVAPEKAQSLLKRLLNNLVFT